MTILTKEGYRYLFNFRTIVLEDNTTQPMMATASLYNEQPTDAGASCLSAELISCPPSISDNAKGGVSVENVPIGNKQWFVLRVSYGRIAKAQTYVEAMGLECYVPTRYKQMVKQCKKRITTEPLLPSFIFIYATRNKVGALLSDISNHTTDKRSLLSFYYDHTSFCGDNPTKNPPLTISDSAMENFIKLTSIKNPHIIPVASENIKYKFGDEVVITEGEFVGIHGRVARIAGQQRVVWSWSCLTDAWWLLRISPRMQ